MTPFLRIFSYSLLILALLVAFNFVVDPYGIYNAVHMSGVNYPKSEAQNYEKLVKAYLASDIKPESIAMGTSRVGFGVDPESRSWIGYESRFNLSLADGSVYVTRRFLEHVIAIQAPKQVVIGLDFFAFNAKRKIANDYSDELLAVNRNGAVNEKYKRHIILSTLLSYSTIKNSIKAIKNSKNSRIQIINPKTGMRQFAINGEIYHNDELFGLAELDYLDNAYKAFKGHAGFYIDEKYFIGDDREYYFKDKYSGNSTLEDFRKIVQLCDSYDIDLYLFISPTHAWHLEEIRSIGLWTLFEQWKRELVQILELEHKGAPYYLWDFSGYNSITSSDVPYGRMREYKDSSHYLPVIGSMVLSRMFKADQNGVPADFGRRLNNKSLENVLDLIRKEQQKYHEVHPQAVKEIEIIAASRGMSTENVIIEGGVRPIGARSVRKN